MPQEPTNKPATLNYRAPVARRHRGFLPDSPFWRNWFVGLFLIGVAFVMIPSPNDAQTLRPVSLGLMAVGVLVLGFSFVHAIGVMFGKWHDQNLRHNPHYEGPPLIRQWARRMVFRYPFLDPQFFAWFSPLLICVITTHAFARPRFRPWWLAVISSLWVMFCLIFAFLLFSGASANSMNPTELDPGDYVLIFAGGWLFSGFVLIWGPELARRQWDRGKRAARGFEVIPKAKPPAARDVD